MVLPSKIYAHLTPDLRPSYAQEQKIYERIKGYNSELIYKIQHISRFENP